MTVVVMGIFSAFSMVRTQKFFSGDDPFLSMIDHPSDNVIDLVKAGFAFSITKFTLNQVQQLPSLTPI